jgi:DNA-binding NarL/FixJ family response regulator
MTLSGHQKLSGIGHLSVTAGLRRAMIGMWRARRNCRYAPSAAGRTATTRLVRQFAASPQSGPPSSHPASQLRQALTGREQDVFSRIAAGMSNGEIAASLFLSEGTVKIHVGRILAKLGLRDRVQAVVLAYESRLITPGTPPPEEPGQPR